LKFYRLPPGTLVFSALLFQARAFALLYEWIPGQYGWHDLPRPCVWI
jgi:hypothetical protein